MSIFPRPSGVKFILVILLLTGFIMLCPVNLSSSLAALSHNLGLSSDSGHNVSTGSRDFGNHPEIVDHVANLLTALNELTILLFIAFLVFVLFSRKTLFLISESFLSRLSYFRQWYKITIKPKLEGSILRWLNLRSDISAFSF